MALTIKCPKHPKYNGRSSPLASCPQCQALSTIRTDALMERLEVKP